MKAHGRTNSNSGKPRRAAIRSGLGAHLRIHAADFLPRWYVLRDLGLARKESARINHRRTANDADLTVAAVIAVPRFGRCDGLSLRASGHARVSRAALCPITGSAAVRYGGHRSTAVVPRGRRETLIRRYIHRLPEAVLHRLPRLLPRIRLFSPTYVEPSLVRPILVGLHRGFVRRHTPCPHIRQLAAESRRQQTRRTGHSGVASGLSRDRKDRDDIRLPLHSRARRRLVQPCHLRNDIPTRVYPGRHTCALADDRTRALDRTGVSRSELGFSMCLPRFLQPG